jgi:hypothetical protein
VTGTAQKSPPKTDAAFRGHDGTPARTAGDADPLPLDDGVDERARLAAELRRVPRPRLQAGGPGRVALSRTDPHPDTALFTIDRLIGRDDRVSGRDHSRESRAARPAVSRSAGDTIR